LVVWEIMGDRFEEILHQVNLSLGVGWMSAGGHEVWQDPGKWHRYAQDRQDQPCVPDCVLYPLRIFV
jgi:hypothetical protein